MVVWCSSYFNQSSEESADEGGETEEMVKQKIAREFRYNEDDGCDYEEDKGDDEGDPLEAFMAGIEVER